MNYEEMLKTATNYFSTTSASYMNSMAPTVVVYKLLKDKTKVNPIYGEEVGGRVYTRGFELKSIYKTDPFAFSFDNGIPLETDHANLKFIFNFNSMVQTIHSIKNYANKIKISARGNWHISKKNGIINIYKEGTTKDFNLDIEVYKTLSDLNEYLNDIGEFNSYYSADDYTACIPDFEDCLINGSIVLQTFNKEFKDVYETVEQGDLIYLVHTNALYEVVSAYPINNVLGYINWQCNAKRTFTYVNYDRLKTYQYGANIDVDDFKTETIKIEDVQNHENNIDILIRKMCKQTDKANNEELDPVSNKIVYYTDNEVNEFLSNAAESAKEINNAKES